MAPAHPLPGQSCQNSSPLSQVSGGSNFCLPKAQPLMPSVLRVSQKAPSINTPAACTSSHKVWWDSGAAPMGCEKEGEGTQPSSSEQSRVLLQLTAAWHPSRCCLLAFQKQATHSQVPPQVVSPAVAFCMKPRGISWSKSIVG